MPENRSVYLNIWPAETDLAAWSRLTCYVCTQTFTAEEWEVRWQEPNGLGVAHEHCLRAIGR